MLILHCYKGWNKHKKSPFGEWQVICWYICIQKKAIMSSFLPFHHLCPGAWHRTGSHHTSGRGWRAQAAPWDTVSAEKRPCARPCYCRERQDTQFIPDQSFVHTTDITDHLLIANVSGAIMGFFFSFYLFIFQSALSDQLKWSARRPL